MKERRFGGDGPGHERSRREDFDPIAEGQRYGLASDVSAAIWDHVRREATNREGLCDEELARERFAEVAKRIAAGGGQLGPAVGKWTQVDVAYSMGSVGSVLTEPAPHKTTLALTREGLSHVGFNRGPGRTTPCELDRITPEESLGFLRGAMRACWFQMAKLAQAVAAIDHGAALMAGNMLRQELRSARWHFANGLAHDENLQRELAAIARPAEALLAKAPAVSNAALNAMRASNRSSELWDREAADWRATIRRGKAANLPTRQGQPESVGLGALEPDRDVGGERPPEQRMVDALRSPDVRLDFMETAVGSAQSHLHKRDGQWLIEHEVAYTVQDRRGLAPTDDPTTVSQPNDAPEREADEVVLGLHSIGRAAAGGAGMSNATNARRDHTPPATQTSLGQLDSGVSGIAADLNDLRVHSSSTATTAPKVSVSTLGHSAEQVAAWRNKLGFAGGQRLGVERGGAERFALERQALAQELAHVAQIRRQPEPGAEMEWAPATSPSAKEIAAADDWLVGDVTHGGGDATPAAALAAEPEGLGPVLTRAIASGSGEPLPAGLRAELETAVGADLSPVRAHHDGAAAQAAAAVAAKAFAVGKDIYFAANAYDPASVEGQRLIAHEVAHTLQPEGQMGAGVTTHNDPVEREANAFVEKFAKGEDGQAIGFAATRTRLPRYPGVVPSALAEDKIRWIDDTDHSLGKVWQEDRGYIKNPTATRLSETVKNGKIAGEFSNGSFMYVVDGSGELWVGKRLQKNMPHPTLIGGRDPKVQSAGMVEIQGGKIIKIDNHSGHFQGPRGSLRAAVKSFMKLPKQVFKKFSAESVHFDAEGKETRQIFKSLRMLKLKTFNPGKSINRLRMRWKNDPKFRGKIKGGLKSAGKAGLAILATLILDYFLSKWMANIEQNLIRQDLERLAPQVEAELLKSLEEQADRLDMLNETNPDATVYFNIVYRLSWMTIYSSASYSDVQANEGYAGAALVSAAISETPAPEELKFESIEGCLGSTTKNERLSMSEAVKVSDLYGDDEDLQADDASTLQQKPVP